MPLDPRSVTSMTFKLALSENFQAILATGEHCKLSGQQLWFHLPKILSLGYESALKQGRRIQWQRLFHSQDTTVSKKALSGPQF